MPKCIALTCFREADNRQITCTEHWALLPLALQQEILKARHAQIKGAEGAPELWITARRQAIMALAHQRQ